MPEPTKITLKKLEDGPIVVVTFDDRRSVSFMPAYDSGPRSGNPVAIGQLKIENSDEEPLAKFFSPFQYPISFRNTSGKGPEYGFQPLLQPHLTLPEIVEYLTKAQTAVNDAFAEKPRRYADHVNITYLATNEITRISSGEYALPD